LRDTNQTASAKPGTPQDDLLIDAWEPALILGDQLRIEAGLTIARNVDHQLVNVGHHGFATVTIPAVASIVGASKVVGHFRFNARPVNAFLSESSKPPWSNPELAAPPASSWSQSSCGIVGSLRRDIVRLLRTHYARPHTKFLTVPAGGET